MEIPVSVQKKSLAYQAFHLLGVFLGALWLTVYFGVGFARETITAPFIAEAGMKKRWFEYFGVAFYGVVAIAALLSLTRNDASIFLATLMVCGGISLAAGAIFALVLSFHFAKWDGYLRRAK